MEPDSGATHAQAYPPPPATPQPMPTEPARPTAPIVTVTTDSPLLHASPAEVGQVALKHTRETFRVRSGTPQAMLARPFSIKEVRLLGIESLLGYDEASAPPMMVVVIKGDLEMLDMLSPSPSDAQSMRVKYVCYLYDLRTGEPFLKATSPNGSAFRQLLNDPTIPEDPTLVPKGTPAPAPQLPTEPTAVSLPPGQIAPTVRPAP